ncbi:MAG: cobyric acid synthase [Chloroflexi bacterium]|nr:cobyric acid synthase [Chloroflexota bacterium]
MSDEARLAPVLLVAGTASSVGKSVLVTALCRIFRQDGVRIAPFKAQNMSNNAAVTADGLEIGRAQAEQARAAGLDPTVEMNPVLLKPQGDRTSQLVLRGRPAGRLHSADFPSRKRDLWPDAARALDELRARFELVIAEGAGSPAEPNLRAGDLANMRVARHARGPALIVGDIDRGGVFAHLLGTLELLPPEDRALVRGFVINRFRGDPSLLGPAIEEIEERTGIPVLGVIPWIHDIGVAEEDAVALERSGGPPSAAEATEVDIAVVQLPRIANFDDFDPLMREPGVRVRYVRSAEEFGRPDLAVLPGTKATAADLGWLRERQLDRAIEAHATDGGAVLGICGGLQLLGERLIDEDGVEAAPGTALPGLGLLPIETRFSAGKTTRRASGEVAASEGPWAAAAGLPVEGYEIHMGESAATGEDAVRPLLRLGGEPDGAISADGRVAGTYLHGLLHNDELRAALLRALGRRGAGGDVSEEERREEAFDRLAAAVREHLDLRRVRTLVGL